MIYFKLINAGYTFTYPRDNINLWKYQLCVFYNEKGKCGILCMSTSQKQNWSIMQHKPCMIFKSVLHLVIIG